MVHRLCIQNRCIAQVFGAFMKLWHPKVFILQTALFAVVLILLFLVEADVLHAKEYEKNVLSMRSKATPFEHTDARTRAMSCVYVREAMARALSRRWNMLADPHTCIFRLPKPYLHQNYAWFRLSDGTKRFREYRCIRPFSAVHREIEVCFPEIGDLEEFDAAPTIKLSRYKVFVLYSDFLGPSYMIFVFIVVRSSVGNCMSVTTSSNWWTFAISIIFRRWLRQVCHTWKYGKLFANTSFYQLFG